ncbi:MAG: glycosyltransferase family 2 protein [Pseudolabrys sp.]
MRRRHIWVVIAAYNEVGVIARVVGEVRRCGYTVLLIDDGSTDATAATAEKAGAVVIHHPVNLGQGAALQTGIEYALREGADVIVTFDADGQHRVADIDVLIDAMAKHNADFVFGSRVLGGAINLPPTRRLLLKAATLFTRITSGLSVTDTHNGLRAMTPRGARAIRLRQNRMAHASEFLNQVSASKLKYIEAPVTIEYSAYSLAKGQKLGNSLSILVDLSAQSLHR